MPRAILDLACSNPDTLFVILKGTACHPHIYNDFQKFFGSSEKWSTECIIGLVLVGQQHTRLKRKKLPAGQSESILILWISLLFVPSEMTFIGANPIWVAKIFIFILSDWHCCSGEREIQNRIRHSVVTISFYLPVLTLLWLPYSWIT